MDGTWFPTLPSGNWAEWFTGLVAAAALAAAIAAARSGGTSTRTALKLLRLEQQREDRTERLDRERRDANERAQAELVAAWRGDARELDESSGLGTPSAEESKLVVRNGSNMPIYSCTAVMTYGPYPEKTYVQLGVITPRTEIERPFLTVDRGARYPGPIDPDCVNIELHFTDAAGRIWRRLPGGALESR